MTEPTPELRRLKEFLKEVESQLGVLEKQLYEFETEYIEQTAGSGNLVQGFDGFQDSKPRQHSMLKKTRIAERDRIFSNSSVTAEVLLANASGLADVEDGIESFSPTGTEALQKLKMKLKQSKTLMSSAFKKKSQKMMAKSQTPLLQQVDDDRNSASEGDSPPPAAGSGMDASLELLDMPEFQLEDAVVPLKRKSSTSQKKRKKHRAGSVASFDDDE